MTSKARPVFLDLIRIKMPVGAVASIGHRVSGLLLVAGVPGAVYLLALSLRSQEGFAHAQVLARLLPAKVWTILLAWALAHHLLAGVRHMFTDVGIGSRLRVARRTAYLVNYGAVGLAVLAAWWLW